MRARRDAAFREALLKEAVNALLSGDVDLGKTLLRDYINATVGFEKLASLTKKSPKSLMRMLGPKRRNLIKAKADHGQHELFASTKDSLVTFSSRPTG